MGASHMRTLPLGPSMELPMGPRNGRGGAEGDPSTHVNPATGAFGGAPYGIIKRVRGVPKSTWDACEPCHWGLRWSSLWGHEACEGCAEMGGGTHANPATGTLGGAPYGATNRVRGVPKWGSMGGADACEHPHWGLRWSSLWGHEPSEWCAKMGRSPHANPATGAFGGAPYGATNRVRGAPKWGGAAMRTLPLGPSVEPPMGPRKV